MVESLLRQTNLWDVRGENLGTFSGGMVLALLGLPLALVLAWAFETTPQRHRP